MFSQNPFKTFLVSKVCVFLILFACASAILAENFDGHQMRKPHCGDKSGTFTFTDPTALVVESRDMDKMHENVHVRRLGFRIKNVSNTPIKLKDICLKYLFTDTASEFHSRVLFGIIKKKKHRWYSYPKKNIKNRITLSFTSVDNPSNPDITGNHEMLMSFASGVLSPKASIRIGVHFVACPKSFIDERNDPSYVQSCKFVQNPAISLSPNFPSSLNHGFADAGLRLGIVVSEYSFSGTSFQVFPELDKTVFTRKYIHPTLPAVTITIDEAWEIYTIDDLVQQSRVVEIDKYGKLTSLLHQRVETSDDDFEPITVIINLPIEDIPYSPPPRITSENIPADFDLWVEDNQAALEERADAIYNRAMIIVDSIDEAISRGWVSSGFDPEISIDAYSGTISATLNPLILSHFSEFDSVSLIVSTDSIEAVPDLWWAGFRMNVDNFHHHGFLGSGINTGVWEGAFPNHLDQMNTTGIRLDLTNFTADDQHVAYMLTCIKNNRTNTTDPAAPTTLCGTGFAPESDLYLANYTATVGDAFDALNWAFITNDVTALSHSWHWEFAGSITVGGIAYGFEEESNGNDSYSDKRIDLAASTFPFATICQSSGNVSIANEFVNHKGYNTIIVGQDMETGYQMVNTSCSRNPSNQQELPHVTAGVNNVRGTSMFEGAGGTSVVTLNGATSAAAAMAAGFVGSLQSMNPALLSHSPWVVRAICMASADNIEGINWTISSADDHRDGAGRLNGINAWLIAQNPYTAGTGANHGFFIDEIASGSTYNRTIPIYIEENGNLRIALSWFGNVNTANYVSTLSDLDLRLTGSGINLTSASTVNPVEMIVINNAEAGETYEITITTAAPVSYLTSFGVA